MFDTPNYSTTSVFRFLVLALLCVSAASAQSLPDLVTDRPDFTESAVVVPLGHVQVEAGVTVVFDDDAEVISGPELLVRWTPLEHLELRFGAPDYLGGSGLRNAGLGDPSLGIKAQFGPLNDWDLGAIATISIPVGDDAFSTNSVDPELILTAGRDLSAWSSLGGQVQAARDGSANVWTLGGTVVLGFVLGDRVGTFVEIASSAPENSASATILHHGYTLLAGRNVQFDVHGGLGLTDAAPDYLVGAGLSVRR